MYGIIYKKDWDKNFFSENLFSVHVSYCSIFHLKRLV